MLLHLYPTSDGRAQGGMRADNTLTAVRAMEVITGVGVGQFYLTNVAQNGLAESPVLL